MEWTRILAYITGSVDQELLLRNEYLAAENRILRAKLNRLLQISTAAQPDTILAWYRRLVARKFDGSQSRRLTFRMSNRQFSQNY